MAAQVSLPASSPLDMPRVLSHRGSCQHASYDEGDLELEGTSILQKRKSLLDLCKMHDLEHASSCPSNMHLQTRFRSSPTSGSPRLPLSPISSVHNHMSTSLVLDSPPPLARVNTEGALDSHVASALRANTQMTLRDVELLEVLGQGGYATTYRARIVNATARSNVDDIVCVKKLKDGTSSDQAYHEVSALQQVQTLGSHPNVVRMLGCNTTTIPYFIVMEYVGGGSLSAEIKRSGSIPLQESMQWLRQIINGLQHLHQSKLLHRDLKSMNVMIKEAESNGDTGKAQGGLSKAVGRRRRTMKIVDFGETKNLRVPSSLTLEVGTYKWMPPEVMGVGDHLRRKSMEGNVQYHSAADVYSLGMVLYEMVSGKEPFDDMARMQAAFAVTKGKRPSFRGVSCPALLEVMIRTCVHADPMERPTLDIMRALAELVEQGYGVTLAGAGGAASASGCDERTREVGKRGGGELAMLRMSVAAALRPMPPQLQGLTASFLQKMTVGDFMWIRETQEYGEGVKENSTEQPVERNPSGLSSPHHPAVATVVAATTASPAEESPGESPRRTPSRKLKELLLGMLPGSTTRR